MSATAQEIAQQPDLWLEVAADLQARSSEITSFLSPVLATPGLRIILTGAGTSAFAGEVLAPALRQRLRRRVDAVATTDVVACPLSIFAEDLPTLLVSFARSGDSPESLAAINLANQCLTQVWHLIVTCNREGRLATADAADGTSMVMLMPGAANDRGFAMTSSFTCMLLATWLVLNRPEDGDALVRRLATAGRALLAAEARMTGELARRGYERVVYLGAGPLCGLGRESALKMLELTAGQVISYYDTPLGFRHGPKSILGPATLVVIYLSGDPYSRNYDDDLVDEISTAVGRANVVVIGSDAGVSHVDGPACQVDGAPPADDAALAILYVLFAQSLALKMSHELELNPDNPFPRGEVNRVVQGVSIYDLR